MYNPPNSYVKVFVTIYTSSSIGYSILFVRSFAANKIFSRRSNSLSYLRYLYFYGFLWYGKSFSKINSVFKPN